MAQRWLDSFTRRQRHVLLAALAAAGVLAILLAVVVSGGGQPTSSTPAAQHTAAGAQPPDGARSVGPTAILPAPDRRQSDTPAAAAPQPRSTPPAGEPTPTAGLQAALGRWAARWFAAGRRCPQLPTPVSWRLEGTQQLEQPGRWLLLGRITDGPPWRIRHRRHTCPQP